MSSARPPSPSPPQPADDGHTRGVVVSLRVPSGAGFPDSAELLDLADTLQELARDLMPGASAHTEVTLTAPPTPRPPAEGIVVDLAEQQVEVDGERVRLARAEVALLGHLALNDGRAVSAARLSTTVWHGRSDLGGRQAVEVSVRRVRRRLGPHGLVVASVPGPGYRLESPVTVLRAGRRVPSAPPEPGGSSHVPV